MTLSQKKFVVFFFLQILVHDYGAIVRMGETYVVW
jgi:hypothetical protein